LNYKTVVLSQAVDFYRGTKLSPDQIMIDIEKNWPSQVDNSEQIIQKVCKEKDPKADLTVSNAGTVDANLQQLNLFYP